MGLRHPLGECIVIFSVGIFAAGKKIARCCNTVQDGLKNLQISYNILNLPQTVTQGEAIKAPCGWFADGSGSTIEQNAYYPFGGRHTFGQTYAQTTANRYKFNGKELQTTGNLGLLDFGARMYRCSINGYTWIGSTNG